MKWMTAFLLAALPAMAADQPIINVIGPTEFEIPAADPTKVVEALPPIALLIATDMKADAKDTSSIRTKVLGVSVGTAARPEYGKAFDFGSFAAGKKGEFRELPARVHLAEIPDPQTYLVRVLLFRDGDPSVVPQTLELKFTRIAAALAVSPLLLENTRLLPFSDAVSLLPNQLRIQELSGRAAPANVQIQLKDFLKGPDDFPVAAQLQVPVIDKIEAGKDCAVKLEVAGGLPLGSTKGNLVIRSRQLSQPVEVTIEILTRTSRWWLVLALTISIVLGYYFRSRLDQRRAENQGHVSAEQQFGLIEEWRKRSIDADLVDKLSEILRTLRTAIDAKPFDATRLDSAAKNAIAAAEEAIKKAETARDALRARLKELRQKLDSPVGEPETIASAVENRLARLRDQERELSRGAVKAVETELDRLAEEIQNELPTVIQAWAQQIHAATGRMGQWAGLELEIARKKLYDTTDAANARRLDLGKTRELAREAQIYLVLAGLQQATELAEQAIQRLEQLKLPPLEQSLAICRAKLEAAKKLPDLDVNQLSTVADKLAEVRSALIDSIAQVVTIKKVARPEGLDEGDFATAIAKLSESLTPREKAWGPGAQEPSPAIAVAKSSAVLASVLPLSGASWWDVQLDVPASPQTDEEITVKASIRGKSPSPVNFEWQIDGEGPHAGSPDYSLTPKRSGSLTVYVRAVDPNTGEVREAHTTVQVRARHGYKAAADLAAKIASDEKMQTFVSGVFIAVAGYAIFQASWYGTILDFLAAALWGFSVDFSVAKVREIAAPILGRPLPSTASK